MAPVRQAAVAPALVVYVYLVLFIVICSLFAQPALCLTTYTRQTLIDIGVKCSSYSFLGELTEHTLPDEILRRSDYQGGHAKPRLRKKTER